MFSILNIQEIQDKSLQIYTKVIMFSILNLQEIQIFTDIYESNNVLDLIILEKSKINLDRYMKQLSLGFNNPRKIQNKSR
jgi:hypothetical protein